MIRLAGRVALAALLGALPVAGSFGGPGVECHIHPPGSRSGTESGISGSYPSVDQCERANLRLNGGGGRCHCLARFDLKTWPSTRGGRPDPGPDATVN
jgi:hypothetical protein